MNSENSGPRSKVPQMNVCISRATLFWIVAGLLILSSWAYAYGRAFKPSTTGHMVRSNDIHSHKVVVGKSSIHGWGVFAARDIHKGEVVEAAPVISDSHAATSSKMMDYVMSISDDEVAYGFGYFTFYNDSPDPDAYFEIDKDLGIVRVVANRHIPAGKEVFMSYGEKYWSTRDIVKK